LLWIDPLVLEEVEAVEDRLERIELRREGAAGRSRVFIWKFLNTFSKPGCIWRAIIGKLLRSSLNDFTFFLEPEGEGEPAWSSALPLIAPIAKLSSLTEFGGMAGVILIGS
jgi:hypothetical protein